MANNYPEEIYLMPGEDEHDLVWCSDPDPTGNGNHDSVEYIRADKAGPRAITARRPAILPISAIATGDETTYLARFRHALAVLCGGVAPPEEMCADWLNSDDEALQTWAVNNTVMDWAMGITVVEAAMKLADEPDEGGDHRPRRESP